MKTNLTTPQPEDLIWKSGRYWQKLKMVTCPTCGRIFTLYRAWIKRNGQLKPISATARCPDCQSTYLEPTNQEIKLMNQKKTNKTKKKSLTKLAVKTKKVLNLPKNIPAPAQIKALQQKFTTGYYQCLADSWGNGKITDCCSKCKKEAENLTVQRDNEIDRLGKAYRQMGESLFTLLKPLKPLKHTK